MPRTPRALRTAAFAAVLVFFAAPTALVAELPSASSLKQIRAVGSGEGTVVEIWADGAIEGYRHFSLPDPPRMVVDFPGLRSDLNTHLIPVGNAQVTQVRVGDHADKVRVVIEVAAGLTAGARLTRGDRGIAFVFGDAEAPNFSSPSRPATAPVARPAPQRAAAAPAARPAPPNRAAAPAADASEQLSRAARDLADAARELATAVRELRAAGLAAAPQPTAPRTAEIEAAERAARDLEVAAREVEGAAGAAPVSAPPAPRESRSEPANPPVAGAPVAGVAVGAGAAAGTAVATATTPDVAAAPTPGPPPTAPPRAAVGAYPHTFDGVVQWVRENGGAVPRFAPGDVIRQGDLAKVHPFMVPGYYEEFDFPGTEIEIQSTNVHAAHEAYQQATLQYQGQTTLAGDGSLLNYIAGKPFAHERIRSAGPREAGLMAAWNNIFRWQHYGYRSMDVPMAYISPGDNVPVDHRSALTGTGNVERVLVTQYQRVYLSHQAALADQNYTVDVADSESQHFKDWMQFTEPFDMRGMAFVIERFLDPHEPDQVNSYMPMERKVRRISAKERSDRFLGSEMTMDDFEAFSGRVLDYEWKFVGEKKVLHVAHSRNDHTVFFGPMSHVPNDRWQLRDCWVVESRPYLPSHPYPRKLMFFDKETYNIPMTLAFDSQDRLLKIIYTVYNWPGGSPSGDPRETVSHYRSSVALNKQTQRSLVNWSYDTEIPEMKASTIRRLFNVSTLTGGR